MPDNDPGPDGRDVELREAVRRLMAFRKQMLDSLRLSYDDHHYHFYAEEAGGARHTLKLMDGPVWHNLEEALR